MSKMLNLTNRTFYQTSYIFKKTGPSELLSLLRLRIFEEECLYKSSFQILAYFMPVSNINIHDFPKNI